MAINFGTGAFVVLQPHHREGLSSDGTPTRTIVYKGEYDAIKSTADELKPGDQIETGWNLSTFEVEKLNGCGQITLTLIPAPVVDPEATEHTPVPLKITWSVHSVRNDRSVMGYCGDSVGANPLREQVEQWMKETDGDLAAAFSYRGTNGEAVTLTNPSKALAAKIAKGIESVIRFYPAVTKRSVYPEIPPDAMSGLSQVESGGLSIGDDDEIPDGLKSRLEDFDWLKVQDDVDQQTDRKWTRIETWWGALKSEGGWDNNLYGNGNDRWEFPASITGGSDD